MANSLYSLFDAIARARNEREIRLHLMDAVGEHFGVQRWEFICLANRGGFPTLDRTKFCQASSQTDVSQAEC